ncbi:Abhydrolase-3 domain-containing protein [Mycena kentingensis (nom. inval.)]|nr:Abhydrolase-3 domain-containing protein [Mycena kentingensis (nom. inval.)]
MDFAPYRHQPFKALYLAYEISTLLLRLPYWMLVSVVSRPRPSWSWKRAVHVRCVRRLTSLSRFVGPLTSSPNHLAVVPGAGYHGLWIDPVDLDSLSGKLKLWVSAAKIEAVRLPGYWLHKPKSSIEPEAPLMPGEKIVYALHGGAYTRLSAHPSDVTSGIARGLLEHVDSVHRIFSIEYRLSSTKPFAVANPFPTALVDALAGYNYLINKLQIPSSDIIIHGDSAGGNLALALTRYLVESKQALPGGIILFSPWADMGTSHHTSDASYYADSDIIPSDKGGSVSYPVLAFTGPFGLGAAELNPYISPASKNIERVAFAGWPRTFISCGGAEILRDSIRTLHERMGQDMGEDVEYLEMPDGVHDFVVFEGGIHEPERTETLSAIAKWTTSLG